MILFGGLLDRIMGLTELWSWTPKFVRTLGLTELPQLMHHRTELWGRTPKFVRTLGLKIFNPIVRSDTPGYAPSDRTLGLFTKVRTNFGVENFQSHSSVVYPRLCTIGPNLGVEHHSSYFGVENFRRHSLAWNIHHHHHHHHHHQQQQQIIIIINSSSISMIIICIIIIITIIICSSISSINIIISSASLSS